MVCTTATARNRNCRRDGENPTHSNSGLRVDRDKTDDREESEAVGQLGL